MAPGVYPFRGLTPARGPCARSREVLRVKSSRRQALLWALVLLMLISLGAWLLRPQDAPIAADLMRTLCHHLASLRVMEVRADYTWTHAGRAPRPAWASLQFSEPSWEMEAWSSEGLHLVARDGTGLVEREGVPGATWSPPRPPEIFRDFTGGFLGLPPTSHQAHPSRWDGAIPYALGPLVHRDPYGYFMVGVLASDWRGWEDGLHHLSFHQEGLDWDLWMDDGARPLPRRVRLQWIPLADDRPGRILDIRYDWPRAE